MEKVVLIAGSETLLGRKLIEVFLNAGCRVIAPVMTSQETLKESKNKNLLVIPWNRSSLISAKTVLRESLRTWNGIDQAVFVNPESKTPGQLHEIPFETIEDIMNTMLHGTIYLIKEILQHFIKEEQGAVAIAETRKGTEFSAPLDGVISGGFHNLAEGLLLTEAPQIFRCGFTSQITEMDEYAEFIRSVLSSRDPRADGEWLKFTEKKSLFQTLPVMKRK